VIITDKDLRMYILVNEDIKINKGKLAGQVGHAVATYIYKYSTPFFKIVFEEYMNNHQKKIILYCPQNKLEELEQQGYITIRDKGWTDLEPNTLTCVNLGIVDYSDIPEEFEFIRELKLVR
jgi:PTH2 family peptidyl-tRNA hydrolase